MSKDGWYTVVQDGIIFIEKEAYNNLAQDKKGLEIELATLKERLVWKDREIELLKEQIKFFKENK